MKRDIIIHGPSSFLGKHLLRYFIDHNIFPIIICRTKSNIDEFENTKLFKIYRYTNKIDEINLTELHLLNPIFIDFAWNGVFGSERNSVEQISVNIPNIISSIEFANNNKCVHWVGFGSQAEYGNLDKIISENDFCKPTTLYGKSKLLCSQISSELCSKFGIKHSWFRLFSVYGPDDNHEWLIQYLIKEMLLNKEINVTKGDQKWDYLYVDDISKMLHKLIISDQACGICNLGSGNSEPVKNLILKIKELTKSNSVINFGAIQYRSDQVMIMQSNIDKLTKILNWKPEINLEIGLKSTINFLIEKYSK
jgi:nucleoside-diphosphate-sugar epimerase